MLGHRRRQHGHQLITTGRRAVGYHTSIFPQRQVPWIIDTSRAQPACRLEVRQTREQPFDDESEAISAFASSLATAS